ncbi:hypothetical protein M2405_006342 [Rhodococcus erythropolis]|nr:hypothetical protein [Rhodococcus erythropolis]MCW2425191.1 hypothetical protein [Rhodococcus erythropolis]
MPTDRHSYLPRSDPAQLAQALFDKFSHRYHRERKRRIAADNQQPLVHSRADDTEPLLKLALDWVPYGGVPEDEVFERYGTSVAGFIDQLWVIVHHLHCDRETVAKLAAVYSKHLTPPTDLSESPHI